MAALAEKGVLCVLVEMPFNLAVFNMNAADGVTDRYPEVDMWYIGGHSLGGAMAAAYVADHSDEYDGLVLLGAYSTADLKGTGLDVLSVFGSEDKVMDREKYDESKSNLPDGFAEIIIEGGCHAYFGMYGVQDGDGEPKITNEEQIYITADAVYEMMIGNKKS
jgi:dienelactone hydrolase